MEELSQFIPVLASAFFGILGTLWSQSKRPSKDATAVRLIEILAGAAAGAAASEQYASGSGMAFSILVAMAAGIVCGFVLDAADELIPQSIRSLWEAFIKRHE